AEKVHRLQGPILVLGASGFVGANLFRMIAAHRDDVFGTTMQASAWRLAGYPEKQVLTVDLLVDANVDALLNDVRPRTIFNSVAYGAYSFEVASHLIYQTNFNFLAKLLPRLAARSITACIHAGSSSEYGAHAAGPDERDLPAPNSDYAVSKVACANLLHYWGKTRGLPCANLRLYSVYGPLEDSSRLIPAVVKAGHEGTFPAFVHPDISRDFVYVDDTCEAFLDAAIRLTVDGYGESFNIGSGRKMTIAEVAGVAAELFKIDTPPVYSSMPDRAWDLSNWFAKPDKARDQLGWRSRTSFRDGLALTWEWYRELPDKERYERASKKFGLDTRHSISAIIACYRDNQAIPIMYERLKNTLTALKVDYEIIFVNDNSPDDSEETIRALSRRDRRVIGISHSRNFGSQAAFRSGMEIATKNACVLLDGDLQDPPELIADFVAQWRQGYDVVYGSRVKREA